MKSTSVILLMSILFLLPLPTMSTGSDQPRNGSDSLSVSPQWPWSKRIAESFVLRHPGAVTFDSLSPSEKWNYEQGLMLEALHQMWLVTKDQRY
jgi:hypothetical protein